MRPSWRSTAALAIVLAAAGLVTAASGLVPIKASSGHWPITAWLLHFFMRRSVATHSLGTKVPALDQQSLVVKGARHYEAVCRSCHGSPEQPLPAIARHMTPQPPHLPDVVRDWKPRELFYIVKHGVKFTGMPAWPAQQRDDEVWAMVAFLLRLPDLDPQAYDDLVAGEQPAPALAAAPADMAPALSRSCDRCHERSGGGTAAFPRLAGQRPAYLAGALQAYARGERHSGIMEPVATTLGTVEMRELALYYASLGGPSGLPSHPADPGSIERGREIAHRGIPSQRVPSCVECHGPGTDPRHPAYPVLSGQHAEYLALQLELFKEGRRGGSPYARLMRPVAARLTAQQARDVALFYESSPP